MINMKKIIASMLCSIMILMSMSTLCFAEVNPSDITLNKRVTFIGDTYWDWNGKKVRKNYPEETSGIILSINNRKDKEVYISGKGYIDKDQIVSIEGKVLEIEFDKENLTSTVKFDGDYVNIESKNQAILAYEDGVLKAGVDGTTTINIETSKGEILEIDATVKNAVVTLNIPEKSVELNVENAALVVTVPSSTEGDSGTEILNVSGSANAKADIALDNGKVTVSANATAEGTVKVKGEEIINAKIEEAKGEITGSMEGVTVSASTKQTYTLLQKIKMKLTGSASATADKEGVDAEGSVGGEITDGEGNEIISGGASGSVSGDYGKDPTVSLSGNIANKEIVILQNKTLPIVTMLKNLFK